LTVASGVFLLLIERRGVQRDVVVEKLPDEREPGEQALACFGEEIVAGVWLDHLACQAVQQVVRRREGRKPLEH
jgi:hypothetical protein